MIQKIIIFLLVSAFSKIGLMGQSFHQLSFKLINGDTVKASDFSGRKVVVVILPLDNKDTVYGQFVKFCDRANDSLIVIGIPSVEQGFTKAKSNSLRSMYTNSKLLIAEGMYSQKASKSAQSLLMQWLTDSNQNRRFNRDAIEAGSKYFINESGTLFAVFTRQTSFQHPIIDQVLKTRAAVGSR